MTTDRSEIYELEEGRNLRLDFDKIAKAVKQVSSILPVAVQDIDTKEVILVAYTNRETFEKCIETRIVTFSSTSRNELWIKGKTSGNMFDLIEVRINCEQNSLLYLVRSRGEGICHTYNSKGKARNCFYRKLKLSTGELENLDP